MQSEIARLMSEPCEAGWDKLKRLGLYLAGVPRLVHRMERQNPPRCVLALSDSGPRRMSENEEVDNVQHPDAWRSLPEDDLLHASAHRAQLMRKRVGTL